jgi:hypothetical protein
MNPERRDGGGPPHLDDDRPFLIGLIALVVVMDVIESLVWLLASAWRFARHRLGRFVVPAVRSTEAAEPPSRAVAAVRGSAAASASSHY